MTQYNLHILPTFRATISKGKLLVPDSEKGRMAKWSMSQNDGEVEIKIGRKTKRRSLKANSYYFAVVLPILAESWGYEDLEELDDALEARFLPKQVKKLGKEEVLVAGRCSKQDTTAFGEFVLKVSAYAAQEGIIIPSPDREYLAHED